LPSVEPIPFDPTDDRFGAALEAQEASYFAASARTASFSRKSIQTLSDDNVLF
jgi:hypothetical protein